MAEKDDYLVDMLVDLGFVSNTDVESARAEAGSAGVGVVDYMMANNLVRPSDGKEPEKIAWLQCVGSRDVHEGAKPYCSAVCCTYAIKEAIVAKEHIKGSLDTAIFYIDMRTHGKDFEKYYNRAEETGVRFLKSMGCGYRCRYSDAPLVYV